MKYKKIKQLDGQLVWMHKSSAKFMLDNIIETQFVTTENTNDTVRLIFVDGSAFDIYRHFDKSKDEKRILFRFVPTEEVKSAYICPSG